MALAKMSTVSLASCADAGGENGQVIPAVYDFDFSDIDGEYVPVITDSLGTGGSTLGYIIGKHGKPIVTPMQCAALCSEQTNPDCWGYTFQFGDVGAYTSAKCTLKQAPASSESYETVMQDVLNMRWGHKMYSGVKCEPPTYEDTMSTNYYTQKAVHKHPSLMTITYTEIFDVFTEDGTMTENDANDRCQSVCNSKNECKGYQLVMIPNQVNTQSNKWRCQLYESDFIAFGDVKLPTTECLLSDGSGCAHLGLRMQLETA